MKILFLFISLFFILIVSDILGQSEKPISKDRFEFLFDSLTAKKSDLIMNKESLLAEIDSLKILLVELNSKAESSRTKELKRKYGRKIGERIENGQVWKGMTEKMLIDSWGQPDKIDSNKEKWGVFSQWYYGDITYFFRDGIMTDWEEKK